MKLLSQSQGDHKRIHFESIQNSKASTRTQLKANKGRLPELLLESVKTNEISVLEAGGLF